MFLLAIVITLASCNNTYTGIDIENGQVVEYEVPYDAIKLLKNNDTVFVRYLPTYNNYVVDGIYKKHVIYPEGTFIVIFKQN